jgi:hypothetical protein
MLEISESYRSSSPPKWMHSTVDRLLSSLPAQFLNGLGTVVLTDSESVGRGRTHRVGGRKYNRRDCRGFYHASTRRETAWIELVADNIVAGVPRSALAVSLVRDLLVSQTLFHEIGHHLDATLGSRVPGSEAAAEDWCRRLSTTYFRTRYWYLTPLFRVAALLWAAIRRLTSRLSGPA